VGERVGERVGGDGRTELRESRLHGAHDVAPPRERAIDLASIAVPMVIVAEIFSAVPRFGMSPEVALCFFLFVVAPAVAALGVAVPVWWASCLFHRSCAPQHEQAPDGRYPETGATSDPGTVSDLGYARRMVAAGMARYITLPVLGACAVAWVLGTYVPAIVSVLSRRDVDYPPLTQWVIQASDIVVRWWLPVAPACALLPVPYRHRIVPLLAAPRYGQHAGKAWNDLILRRPPVITYMAVCVALAVIMLAFRITCVPIAHCICRY